MFNLKGIELTSKQNQKIKNLRLLWNKYKILKRLARFDTVKFELYVETALIHFETLCINTIYSHAYNKHKFNHHK